MKRLPDFLLQEEKYRDVKSSRRTRSAFIDKTLQKLAALVQLNFLQSVISRKYHFISTISIRTKLIVFIYFILLISFIKTIQAEISIGALLMVLHLIIRIQFINTYKRILFFTFIFGFLIAFPSALNLITRGEIIFPLLRLQQAHDIWIYHIPSIIGFTSEGLRGMMMLTLRVFNSISISFLLINSTSFNDIIKGLKMFRIPDSLLMIFTLSYLYVVILANSVLESYLALKARIIGHIGDKKVQELIAGRITHIFKMSRRHFEKTYQAMLARGYTGEVILYQKEKFALSDYLILGITGLTGLLFYFV